MDCFRKAQRDFADLPDEEQPDHLSEISGDCMMEMLLYAYDHLEEFKLLLCCSRVRDLPACLMKWWKLETKGTHDYLRVLKELNDRLRRLMNG